MQALKTQRKASRYLALLTLAVLASAVGCGGNEGGNASSTAGAGGSAEGGTDTAGGGGTATGGTATSAGDAATGGSADGGADTGSGGSPGTGGSSARGGTSAGGTSGGGGVTGARSCELDCVALASSACAGADFTHEKCVTDCQKAFQSAAADAKAAGCLNEFLALDACRVNDPVCTHPNPRECVPENDAYIQCLQNSI